MQAPRTASVERHRRRWPLLAASALVLVLVVGGLIAFPPGSQRARAVMWGLRDHIGEPTSSASAEPFARSNPPRSRFAVVGDVGTGGREELATAAAVARSEREGPFDGLVLLGDNVYPDGDPSRLDDTVFEPFGPVLDQGTALLPVLGNHDVQRGNGPRQQAALGLESAWYARRFGEVLYIGLDSTRASDPEQQAWLARTLADSTEPWKIVAMHFPPYSAGYHGSNEATRRAFSPLFERYGVQLVLSGHDHDYQRSRTINGVTYIVSGGAAKLRGAGRSDFTAASWSTSHFVDVAVWGDRLQLRARQQDGRVFDSITLRPKPVPVG